MTAFIRITLAAALATITLAAPAMAQQTMYTKPSPLSWEVPGTGEQVFSRDEGRTFTWGSRAKNKIYGKTTAVVVGSGYWDTTWVGGGRTTCIRLRKGSDSTELC
jgi:hypothetical protein